MRQRILGSEFRATGIWFVADEPEVRYKGTLSAQHAGIDVTLLGDDRELVPLMGYASRDRQNILGELSSGERVTLFNAFTKTSSHAECEIIANGIVFGAHLPDLNEVIVKKAFLSIDDAGWVDLFSRLEHEFVGDDEVNHNIKISKPTAQDVGLLEGGDVIVRVGWRYSERVGFRKYEFDTESVVELDYSTPHCSFWKSLRDINSIRTLLSLLAGSSLPRRSISMELEDASLVEIYLPTTGAKLRGVDQSHRPLTSLKAIVNRFPEILMRWEDLSREEPAVPQIMSRELSNHIFGEDKLFALIQVLESLSRSTRSASVVERRIFFEEVVPALTEAIPSGMAPEIVAEIEQKIRTLNLKSLRLTLLGFLEESGIHGLESDIDLLKPCNIAMLVKTRNYLAHKDPKGSQGIFTGGDFLAAIDQAQTIAHALIFWRLGFSIESIVSSFRKFYPFQSAFNHKFDGSKAVYFAHKET